MNFWMGLVVRAVGFVAICFCNRKEQGRLPLSVAALRAGSDFLRSLNVDYDVSTTKKACNSNFHHGHICVDCVAFWAVRCALLDRHQS